MPVRIVEELEVVDVNEEDPERGLSQLVSLDCCPNLRLDVRAVADTRQWIEKDRLLCGLGNVEGGYQGLVVGEQLDRARRLLAPR